MACLHACTSCGRHVRATERTCPFCEASLGAEFIDACPRKSLASKKQMTRAALLFAGAAAIAACGGKEDSSSSSGSVVPLYGPAPVHDASTEDASDASEADDAHGAVVLYGPAPVDAGDG